jgi:hypothetical protein
VTNVIALADGDQHCVALKADGTVASWGDNPYGQTNVPPGLTNVVSIAAGSGHSLALRRDGTLAFWGLTLSGGATTVPDNATNIVALALGPGAQHALVLRSDGTVLDWGGSKVYGLTNIPATARDVVAVAAGATYCLALRADGHVVAWGYNATPVPANVTNVAAIATGWFGNAALRPDGTLLVWGSISTPTTDFTNVVDVACPFSGNGTCAVLAVRSDGTLAVTPGSAPAAATNVVAVAAGGFSALALVGSGPPVFPGLPVNRTVTDGSTAYLRSWCPSFALSMAVQRYRHPWSHQPDAGTDERPARPGRELLHINRQQRIWHGHEWSNHPQHNPVGVLPRTARLIHRPWCDRNLPGYQFSGTRPYHLPMAVQQHKY